jgi:carboxynorspermidine decarboxylase
MTREGYDTGALVSALRGLRERHPNLRIILEPGAAFVWNAGVLVATVEDVVESDGVRTAMLDISFACHLPDCLEMPYTPAVRGAATVAPHEGGWRLGGCSCLAGDFVGNYRFQEDPSPGRQVVFLDMMHYTMVKTTLFNGIRHPAIGILDDKGGFELVRDFSYGDYASRAG